MEDDFDLDAQTCALDVLGFLLQEAKCDPNIKNTEGNTPAIVCAQKSPNGYGCWIFLHNVIRYKALKYLELLHLEGADMADTTKDGTTLAMILLEDHGSGPWEEWLFKNGCSESAKNEAGMSAEDCFKTWRSQD
eukprot:Platyproteum_vivax@DN7310_c0_g1_i2.p1